MGNSLNIDDVNLDEWVVVKTIGGGFLGRVKNVTLSKLALTPSDDRLSSFKEKVIKKSFDEYLELSPAFDFMAPLRPTPNGLSREPIVTPLDFTSGAMPVCVRPSAVYFLGEMSDDDKKTYKSFIAQTLTVLQHLRAKNSDLILPGPGGIARG